MDGRSTIKGLMGAVLVVAVLVALLVGLSGCESADRAAADRASAEAALVRAETQAAAERSQIRIAETNALLTQALAMIPYVILLGGGLLLAGGLGFVVWDIRTGRAQPQADPYLVALLEQQNRRLAEVERETWHAIAAGQRAALRSEVVIYPEDGR